jgi:hypothetical protein
MQLEPGMRLRLALLVGLAAFACVAAASGSVAIPKTLTVAVSGGGTVTSSPVGIRCPPGCRARFTSGARVRLTAKARTGWTFARWLRSCAGSRSSCVVRMNVSRLATAVFTRKAQPPPPPPPVGTRDNPVPLGQPAPLGNGWTLMVTQYFPDATAAVLAANQFNDPAPAGSQDVGMVAVSATYNGTGSSHLDSGYMLRAVGARNVAYTTFTSPTCGVLPEPNLQLNDPEVFTGGTVSGNAACWVIPSSDVGSLVMFTAPLGTSRQVFFALR